MTASWRHKYPYDTHPQMVINRAKFDVCTPSSLAELKRTCIHTYAQTLYVRWKILLIMKMRLKFRIENAGAGAGAVNYWELWCWNWS